MENIKQELRSKNHMTETLYYRLKFTVPPMTVSWSSVNTNIIFGFDERAEHINAKRTNRK